MLQIIDGAYAARVRGDMATLASFFTPYTSYRMVGEPSMLPSFPLSGPAEATTPVLLDLIQFHEIERLDALVEGNRAAVRWRVTASSGGGPAVTTEIFDLWELTEDGRAVSLVQFTDTAMLAGLLS